MSHIIRLWRFITEHKYMLLAIYQIVIFPQKYSTSESKNLMPYVSVTMPSGAMVWPFFWYKLLCEKYGSNCDIPSCDSLFSHPIPYSRVNSKQSIAIPFFSWHFAVSNQFFIFFFTFRLDGALFSRETEWLWLTVTTLLFSSRVTSAKLNTVAVTYYLNLNMF